MFLERTGAISMNLHSTLLHVTEDEMIRRHIYFHELAAERMRMSSLHHSKQITKMTMIFDMTGTSMIPDPVGLRLFRKVTTIDSNFYPERLGKLLLINCNWMFRGLWSIVHPLLDPVSRTKIEILGTDYKSRLLELIDPSQLPVEFGGTCSCGYDGKSEGDCLAPIRSWPRHDGELATTVTDGWCTIRGPG